MQVSLGRVFLLMKRFYGKNIVVTGASRGIGAGIAYQLASEGARVALTYSTQKEKALQTLKNLPGEGHLIVNIDIKSEESILKGFEEIFSQFDSLNGLVNNAGITKDQLILRMKCDDFDSVIQTNLRGTFLCIKSSLKSLMKTQGAIVNLTSVIGQSGNAGQANYAASKAGIEALSKSVAHEMGSRGIRVNCVAPGFIVTEMTDQLSQEQKDAILNRVPLKSMGRVEDVACAVAFLLSDESKYITGHTLCVNGGLRM